MRLLFPFSLTGQCNIMQPAILHLVICNIYIYLRFELFSRSQDLSNLQITHLCIDCWGRTYRLAFQKHALVVRVCKGWGVGIVRHSILTLSADNTRSMRDGEPLCPKYRVSWLRRVMCQIKTVHMNNEVIMKRRW